MCLKYFGQKDYLFPPPLPPPKKKKKLKRYQNHICVSNFSITEYGQIFLKEEFLLMVIYINSARFLELSSKVPGLSFFV